MKTLRRVNGKCGGRARLALLTPVALALVVLAFAMPVAFACCAVFRGGEHVQIADQEILVAWDAASRTEHFIRRASFATRSASFGFLVPTPSVPQLGEVSDGVFARLGKAIEPEHRHVRVYEPTLFLFPEAAGMRASLSAPASGAVRVLGEQRVAGYDAVILEADDPDALVQWLAKNGYDSRPEMSAWLAPYVAQRWKITAFKLASADDGSLDRATEKMKYAVRMSFETDRPLFPFRTPADQQGTDPSRGGGNLLRVYVAAGTKVAGMLGADSWDARTTYARGREDLGTVLGDAIPAGPSAAPRWLTVFEDRRWPRAADADLYFAPSDAVEVLPPPIIHRDAVMVPVDLILLFGVLAVVLALRRVRRARSRLADTDA